MVDRPFVVEPPGDAVRVRRLAEHAASVWGLPEPELMRVGMNALYVAGDEVVIRIGRPTSDPGGALRLAELLRAHGIRVPTFVRAAAIIDGPLAAMAIAREHTAGEIDWPSVGEMVARVHAIDPSTIDPFYPVPRCTTFPWWQFDGLLADVADLLDDTARRGIIEAIMRHREWPARAASRWVLCHGDVHPGNVLATAGGAVLIDWDLLCRGPVGWDHAPLLTWAERWGGEPGLYERFATGYGASLRSETTAEAIAELRLVAATLMRLRSGRSDPAAAVEAEQRLRFWRGDPDAPAWQAA